jgi:hypothetical protein
MLRLSNFTLHQTARSRCSLAAGERARYTATAMIRREREGRRADPVA